MPGTDHPPSTTGPATPTWARRVALANLSGLLGLIGALGAATGSAGSPLDVEAGGTVPQPTETVVASTTTITMPAEVLSDSIRHAGITAPASDAAAVVAHDEPPPTTTTTQPPPTTTTQPPPPPTTTTQPPPRPSGRYGDPHYPATWDRLAQCESSGNWHIDTGNGFYGGLQFTLRSWRAVGGTGYPHEHSRETQIRMGIRLWEIQGWGAWPSCSRQLGYR